MFCSAPHSKYEDVHVVHDVISAARLKFTESQGKSPVPCKSGVFCMRVCLLVLSSSAESVTVYLLLKRGLSTD